MPENLKLKYWQYDVLKKIHESGYPSKILGMDTGTGKTSVALTLHRMLNPARHLIVTKPLLITQAWKKNNEKFSQFQIPMTALNGKNYEEAARPGTYVCSYDRLRINRDFFNTIKWDMVTLDESHKIGNYGSKCSQAAIGTNWRGQYKGGLKYDRCYLLSGTMIPNHEKQIYPQLRMAGYKENWSDFKDRFFHTPDRTISGWIIFKESKREEFNQLLSEYAIVVRKEDTDIGGKKQINIIDYTLSPLVTQLQKDLAGDGVARIKDIEFAIDYKIAEFTRFRQLAKGYMPDVNGHYWVLDETPYLMLNEFLEDRATVEPYVVVYNFDKEAGLIMERLNQKIPVYHLHGKMSGKNAQTEIIDKFGDSKNGVLLAQQSVIEEGVDICNTNKMVFFSLNHSLKSFTQCCDRIHGVGRGVAGQDPTYYIFQAEGTMDEEIYNLLLSKRDMVEGLKEWIRLKSQ